MRFEKVSGIAAVSLLLCGTPPGFAEMSPRLQQRVRAATFEVVMPKAEQDSLSYEKPLPLDLIPFQQRSDKFRPIGTAFAVGPNQFVSAAHVFGFSLGGPTVPRLRGADGKVHDIGEVQKYSEHEDYIVFTLREAPARQGTLAIDRQPAMNQSVQAVGNALGEGIVFRDGLLTSETPEPLDGQWKYLRFSAPASPGNSGGPLVDARGQVLGIVSRKSPSENLNMAVPIARALDGPQAATARSRGMTALPVMPDVREKFEVDESFPLPLSYDAFASQVSAKRLEIQKRNYALVAGRNADKLFPDSEGAQRLLHRVNAPQTMGTLRRGADGQWTQNPSYGTRTELGRNGYVEIGGSPFSGYANLRRPDDMDASVLAGDPKLLMDTLLKGMQLRRTVGSDRVLVTSLGKPRRSAEHVDRWGRRWQTHHWSIEHDDTCLVAFAMPTPQGYLVTYATLPAAFQDVATFAQQYMTDFTGLSWTGNALQWRGFLAGRPLPAQALAGIDVAQDGSRFTYRSPRLSLEIPAGALKLNADSQAAVLPSFFPEGGRVTWDVAGVSVRERSGEPQGLFISRRIAPPASVPEADRNAWAKIAAAASPWNGMPYSANSTKRIGGTVRAGAATAAGPGAAAPVYTVEYVRDADTPDAVMRAEFARIMAGIRILETP
jgi:hypothetical protein